MRLGHESREWSESGINFRHQMTVGPKMIYQLRDDLEGAEWGRFAECQQEVARAASALSKACEGMAGSSEVIPLSRSPPFAYSPAFRARGVPDFADRVQRLMALTHEKSSFVWKISSMWLEHQIVLANAVAASAQLKEKSAEAERLSQQVVSLEIRAKKAEEGASETKAEFDKARDLLQAATIKVDGLEKELLAEKVLVAQKEAAVKEAEAAATRAGSEVQKEKERTEGMFLPFCGTILLEGRQSVRKEMILCFG